MNFFWLAHRLPPWSVAIFYRSVDFGGGALSSLNTQDNTMVKGFTGGGGNSVRENELWENFCLGKILSPSLKTGVKILSPRDLEGGKGNSARSAEEIFGLNF